MVLLKDGTVWSTGYNAFGQLGVGHNTSITLIDKVRDVAANPDAGIEAHFIEDAKHIKKVGHTSYILKEGKGMYVAGQNTYSQLFTGDKTNRNVATLVQKDKDILKVSGMRNVDGNAAGAIADQDGMVYTVRI